MSNAKLLRRQLENQAKLIEEQKGLDLAESLLNASSSMMAEVNTALAGVDISSEAGFNRVYALYYPVISQINDFMKNTAERMGLNNEKADFDKLQKEIANLQATCKDISSQNKEAREKLAELRVEYSELRERFDDVKETADNLVRENTSLKEKLEGDYSLENIENIKKENAELEKKLESNKLTYQDFIAEREKKQQEIDAISLDISKVERKIKSFPDEIVILRDKFDEDAKRLASLEKTKEECSKEKQDELQEKIDILQVEVEKLTNIKATLDVQKSNLDISIEELKQGNEKLEADILNQMKSITDVLMPISTQRHQHFTQMKDTVLQLISKIDECQTIQKKYSGWLDADKNNFRGMENVTNRPVANDNLVREMVFSREHVSETIKTTEDILKSAKENLKGLDEMLRRAVPAAVKDYREQRKRAQSL